MSSSQPTFPFCALIACITLSAALAMGADMDLRQKYALLEDEYRSALASAAKSARDTGQADLANRLDQWLPPRKDCEIWGALLPRGVAERRALTALPAGLQAFRGRHAEELFALAQEAAAAGEASLALELAAKTLRENPDHAGARRVLGYDEVDSQWLTPFEQQMRQRGNVWHDRFGWIRASDVEKYDSGMRPRGRAWITAEQDAQVHRTIDDGWLINTAHFLIKTNHSLEAGVALGTRLEQLHDVWRVQFADFWLTARELEDVFAGHRRLPGRSQPHQVWYFKNRDQYNAALRREQPRIDITLGIYFDNHRRAYFFAGEDQHAGTIYHEAVHQLFQESRSRSTASRLVGRANNVWIIEGIATYFETLTIHDDPSGEGYYTLGGTNAGRLPSARARVLQENYYIPLAELVRLGKDDLQRRSDLTQLYSQLAGLTTFFMHAQGGRCRRPLTEYLSAVYNNRASDNTLSELTEQSYAELDAKYRQFLETLR